MIVVLVLCRSVIVQIVREGLLPSLWIDGYVDVLGLSETE
jgi:hypothetical protein